MMTELSGPVFLGLARALRSALCFFMLLFCSRSPDFLISRFLDFCCFRSLLCTARPPPAMVSLNPHDLSLFLSHII